MMAHHEDTYNPAPCGVWVATNPDLTGIGVRFSLYAQAFFLVFAPLFLENTRALSNIFSNALLSSVSLMAVTLVNVNTIAFVDGLTVTFLQSILVFTTFVQVEVLIALQEQPIWILYLLAILLRTVLEIIFWGNINAPSPLTCTGEVLSQQTTARQKVRYFTIVILGVTLLLAVPMSILAKFHGPRRSRNPWRIITVPMIFIGNVLQIVVVEFIIGTDDSVSGKANSWTHGQILSLLLVGSNVLDFITALKSPHRDLSLFSWRGMRLDYQICEIRLRKRFKKLSGGFSGDLPANTHPNSFVRTSVVSQPPLCVTEDHIYDRRTIGREKYDGAISSIILGRDGHLPGGHKINSEWDIERRQQPWIKRMGGSAQHINAITTTSKAFHAGDGGSIGSRRRRWST